MKPFEARHKIIEVYLEVRSIRKTAELLEISRNTVGKWARRFEKKAGRIVSYEQGTNVVFPFKKILEQPQFGR